MTVTRFAPAPTGFLHLGHVVNAVYVWGVARARGGRVIIRIEDHDRARSTREYDRAILEDLDWLGFAGDTVVRQSDRSAIYECALDRLRAAGLVYACSCSRADILAAAHRRGERMASRAVAADDELRYDGTCAHKHLPEAPGRGVRVRLAPSIEEFVDLRHGPQRQCPAEQCGDLLARDRDGNWTYQFAAAVDDFEQRVTLVIRGDDLLPSTGRQLQLARLLGRVEPPEFLHHPLIMKTAAQKISKSDGDTGVRDLRARSWTASAVIGHAARLAGLVPAFCPIAADDVSSIIAP
jgi:glutamyl/glutaminyl-tRNA synthetase